MSQSDRPRSRKRLLALACLALPFVALLWVPAYAGGGPPLAGVPFFYWYQFLWVLLTPAFMTIAYRLLRRTGNGQVAETAP